MLSEVPEGWEITTIGSICVIARGGSPRPIDKFMTDAEDGINWIKIGDASASSKYIYTTKEKIKPEGAKKSRRVQSGDFLLSNSMSFGRPYILRTDGCIHDGWLSLSFDRQKLGEEFLYYLLSSPLVFNQFSEKAAGSAVKNLNKDLVSSIAVSLPPYIEQHRIAEILSSVDESIQATQAVIEQAERVKRGLMEELLTGGLGGEAIERGEVPEGWIHFTPLSIYASNETQKWNEVEALPYIGLEHIEQRTGRLLGFGESQHVTSAKNVFEPGDVLFGKLRPNLRKYWKADRKGICSTDILVLRGKQGLENDYLFAVVQSEPFLSFAENDAAGTKMPRTSWKRLGTIELPIPPLNEQKRIAEILSSVDETIASHKANIEQQSRVKKGLMDDLLTGRVRTV